MARRVRAASAPSPAPPSAVPRSGVPAAGRSVWATWMARASVCSIARSLPRRPDSAPCDSSRRYRRAPARHRAGPRMERADATGGGAGRWLCLERQDLSEPVQGCLRDHRHPLEWTEVLRPARQTIEGRPRHEDRISESRFAARSIPASRPTRGSSRTSTRSTPSTMPRRPISAARPMPGGRCCGPNTTTAASRAATPTGLPCSGSWRTCGPARST